MIRPKLRAAVLAVGLMVLTACDYAGAGSLSLPFTHGRDDDAVVVTVELENAANLVPNSEVKVGNVTVGSIRRIEFDDWHAKLTVGLDAGTTLPKNATARIGQKSLLGAEYLEIAAPARPHPATLESGDVIPLSRTGRYPETEEVLAALSTLLNGGGLAQIRTITTELNSALDGHQTDWRSLIARLTTFVSGLDAQREDLVRVLHGMNRLGGTLNAQRATLTAALDTLPAGLASLEKERPQLVEALQSVGEFGATLSQVVSKSQDNMVGTLHDLNPVLERLADAGPDLPKAAGMLTFPFPVDRIVKIVRGDYANLFINVDLSASRGAKNFLAGTPLEGLVGTLTGEPARQPTGGVTNPLTAPLDLPGLDDIINRPEGR